MTTLFVLDVPEFAPVAKLAEQDAANTVDKVGPFFRITSDGPIVIDRRTSGCRHAVWYSAVGGVLHGYVTQHDKEALRIEPT